jgi:hypothetical protein
LKENQVRVNPLKPYLRAIIYKVSPFVYL